MVYVNSSFCNPLVLPRYLLCPINNDIDSSWETVAKHVGNMGGGTKRAYTYQWLDNKYGNFAWRVAWQYGDDSYLTFAEAAQVYEDAYFDFLSHDSEALEYILANASDVYDTDPSNVDSGTDYLKQDFEADATHLQDIAIRRVVARMSREFCGDKLIQVRSHSKDAVGSKLSPFVVPFHEPDKISQPEIRRSWKKGSIESFWQSNKVIQANSQLAALSITGRSQLVKESLGLKA